MGEVWHWDDGRKRLSWWQCYTVTGPLRQMTRVCRRTRVRERRKLIRGLIGFYRCVAKFRLLYDALGLGDRPLSWALI